MAPPPRHADSLAPDYGRGRALRLRASGRPRRATEAAQPRTGTRRAALLGPCARARAPWRYTPSRAEEGEHSSPGRCMAEALPTREDPLVCCMRDLSLPVDRLK